MGQPSREIGHKISLVSTFIQGCDQTEQLISEGYHSKAAAALKQDMELLTRIREVDAGAAKSGVTPHMRHAPTGSARLYGDLNKVAHPSHEPLLQRHLEQVTKDDVPGVSPFPTFVEQTIKNHYWIHAWLCYEFSRESVRILMENYGDDPYVTDCAKRFTTLQTEGIEAGILKVVGTQVPG